MITEIKAPEEYRYWSIFLAGSIEMDEQNKSTAIQWQKQIMDLFKHDDRFNKHNLLLLNPRRDNWNPEIKPLIESEEFVDQVAWETDAMNEADIILMYFDPNTKSPITLLELGLYADKDKLFVCCPEGFWRKGNVDFICEKYEIPMFEDLQELVNCVYQVIIAGDSDFEDEE